MTASDLTFRSKIREILRILGVLAALIALSVSVSGAGAQQGCCPMLAVDAPCPADATAACGIACSFCQAQLPLVSAVAAVIPRDLTRLLPLGLASLDQLLDQPATPPPRWAMIEA